MKNSTKFILGGLALATIGIMIYKKDESSSNEGKYLRNKIGGTLLLMGSVVALIHGFGLKHEAA